MSKKFKRLIPLSILVFFFCISYSVHAAPIDSTNKIARFLESSYGTINFNPTNGNVSVTNSAMTGYAWGNIVGWINLAPTNGGVVNDGSGNLSGYAWGENAGWINFNPTNGGVTINSSGDFEGYAWSQNYGWIVFNCATDSSCGTFNHKVSTTWSASVTYQCNDGINNDSDSFIDYPNDPGCSSVTDNDESNDPGGPSLPPITPPVTPPEVIVDVCPNIGGNQTTMPTGYILDGFGNCVLPVIPTDVCPNMAGDQATVPSNRVVDQFGNCIIPEVPTDLCPNIGGDQASLPAGMVYDIFGNCVSITQTPPTEPPILPPVISIPSTGIPIVDNFISGGSIAIQETYQGVKDIYNDPVGSTVTKTLSTVGVVTGGAMAVSSVLLTPTSFVELALAPFRLWTLLLSFLGLRKKYKPWGTVYDSITKQPLDPAYVILTDENGKEVTSSITDIDGRYGFLTQPGRYKMIANKTNYEFPSKNLLGKTSDELYSNLYFGETIVINQESDVITKSIPMDPLNFDWNEFAKKNKNLMKFYSRFDFIVAKVSNIFFIVGFLVAVVALFAAPQPYNLIIFILYVGLIIMRMIGLKPKSHGYLSEKISGNPLSFAIIRVMSADLDTEIAHKISDAAGRYFCLIPNERYYLKIEKKKPDQTYEHVFTTEVLNIKKGIINKKIEI